MVWKTIDRLSPFKGAMFDLTRTAARSDNASTRERDQSLITFREL